MSNWLISYCVTWFVVARMVIFVFNEIVGLSKVSVGERVDLARSTKDPKILAV